MKSSIALAALASLTIVGCPSKNAPTPEAHDAPAASAPPSATVSASASTSAAPATRTGNQKLMADVAIEFAEECGRRDLEGIKKHVMGPEVCEKSPPAKRRGCDENVAAVRKALPQIAEKYPKGFLVKDVSFEPLPGSGGGGMEGATVTLEPKQKEHGQQGVMVGIIDGKAYVMIALPAGDRKH